MTITMFLLLLSVFSVMTGLITEGVKKFILDKNNRVYNLVALIVALIVGIFGVLLYYRLNHLPIISDTLIYAILMGFASAISSMVGFDKVKQCIEQLGGIK